MYQRIFEESVNSKKWYHGTSIKNYESIQKKGFKKSINSIFGSGIYLSTFPHDSYEANIEVKIKTRKILETEYIKYPDIYEKLVGRKPNGISGEERALIKLGYDGVYITDDNFIVIFDPKNIKIVGII